MNKKLLFVILFVFLITFVMAMPLLILITQTPSDISTVNLYNAGLNISYNITDSLGAGINNSTVYLFYRTNSSIDNNTDYINGTAYPGYFNTTGVNQSTNWTFSLDDNDIYPLKSNINQDTMENTPHAINTMTNNRASKIQFLNISNNTSYNVFEFMANTSGSSSLFIFYCNSSYVSGTVTTNANCIQFGTLAATSSFNITNPSLNNSRYQLVGLTINTTTGLAQNAVYVTNTSYFVLLNSGAGTWNVYNVPITSRIGAMQTSTNSGGSWTSQTYTIDAHLHQYSGDNTVYYYTCASNSTGFNNCSSINTDLLQIAGLPPSVPHVSIPANQSYNGVINISYLASISPNGYSISYYNITLNNIDESYNKTILSNNSVNLSYLWNTVGIPDGNYLVKVIATDNQSQTSFDLSDPFTIDNTPPIATASCTPPSVYLKGAVTCTCSGTDATSGVNSTTSLSNPDTSNAGTYTYGCTVTDFAGNSAGSTASFSVIPYPSGQSSSLLGSSLPAAVYGEYYSPLQNNTVSINFSNSSLGLSNINIETYNQSSVHVSTTEYSDLSSLGISSENFKHIYQCIQINLNQANISWADLTFKVNKSWVFDNKINVSNISIFKSENLTNNTWIIMPTTYIGNDDNFYYYKTSTNSFSYFLITGNSLNESGTTETNQSTLLNKIKTISNAKYIPAIIGGLIIIAAGIILTKKKKK